MSFLGPGLVPFVRFFPDQAAAETRVFITIKDPVLPADEYGLLESYCADPQCNCRRVMLNVVGRRQQRTRDCVIDVRNGLWGHR